MLSNFIVCPLMARERAQVSTRAVEANGQSQVDSLRAVRRRCPPLLVAGTRCVWLSLLVLVLLPCLTFSAPTRAAIDFNAAFSDIDTATPYRASYLLAGMNESGDGDATQRNKRWERLGLTPVAFESVQSVGAQASIVGTDATLFVVLRGSTNWKDYAIDAATWKEESAFGPFRLHAGFVKQAQALRDFVARTVRRERGNRKLWITGHSLGGALAKIIAYDLQVNQKIPLTGVVTFGAPRAGGDGWRDAYEAVLKDRTWRWINQHDNVPHLPSGDSWKQVGKKNIIRKNEIRFEGGDTPDGDSAAGDHPMEKYLQALYDNMPASKRAGLPRPQDLKI